MSAMQRQAEKVQPSADIAYCRHSAAWLYAAMPLRWKHIGEEVGMKRREFIAGIGVAATWPTATRAQQKSKPVIGYLGVGDLDGPGSWGVRAFRQELRELGYV